MDFSSILHPNDIVTLTYPDAISVKGMAGNISADAFDFIHFDQNGSPQNLTITSDYLDENDLHISIGTGRPDADAFVVTDTEEQVKNVETKILRSESETPEGAPASHLNQNHSFLSHLSTFTNIEELVNILLGDNRQKTTNPRTLAVVYHFLSGDMKSKFAISLPDDVYVSVLNTVENTDFSTFTPEQLQEIDDSLVDIYSEYKILQQRQFEADQDITNSFSDNAISDDLFSHIQSFIHGVGKGFSIYFPTSKDASTSSDNNIDLSSIFQQIPFNQPINGLPPEKLFEFLKEVQQEGKFEEFQKITDMINNKEEMDPEAINNFMEELPEEIFEILQSWLGGFGNPPNDDTPPST